MDFAVLGTVQIHGLDGPIRLRGKPAAALCTLLLHVDTVVSKDRLVSALWDDPPHSAVANVQTYIAQIRRALQDTALTVTTEGSGYLCTVAPQHLDLLAFQESLRRARKEARRGELDAADREFARAVSLWRGDPAEDVPLGTAMAPRVTELVNQLAVARSEWIDVRLALGHGDELVAELRDLVAAHPLRERLWAQLMLALDQAGRRGEALSAFGEARQALSAELGIEPGPELTALHASILGSDPVGDGIRLPRIPQSKVWVPVCQLPPDIADFVGRRHELDAALSRLRAREGRGSPTITILSGPPGVGKTTLAVHLAHLLRADYPDGQLFARASQGSLTPRDPADLLGELLHALGVNRAHLPAGVTDRAALFRQRLADRAVLIVLDDAVDAAQVRPFLPGTAGNAVLVTSRGRIPTLEGAHQLLLGQPSHDDARLLLEKVVGDTRLLDDHEAIEKIIAACGGLPLAIRVVGARLATRPTWPLQELAGRLEVPRRLFNELVADGLDVRATFHSSYAALPDGARRVFRLLGLAGLDSFAHWAVTALMGDASSAVDEHLELLVLRSLLTASEVDVAGQPRYRLPDLLRAFAYERAQEEESLEARAAALTRLVTACLGRAGGDAVWRQAERHTLAHAAGLAKDLRLVRLAAQLSTTLATAR